MIFGILPFLEIDFVFQYIGKDWLNEFYLNLKSDIDTLGFELYGSAYPNFEKVKEYNAQRNKLLWDKKYKEFTSLKIVRRADYKQKTNNTWYPRYRICKEKISVLKASHPYGYKILVVMGDGLLDVPPPPCFRAKWVAITTGRLEAFLLPL